MQCPVCSRTLDFKWKDTNLAQCRCNAVLFLTEAGEWTIGTSGLAKIPAPWLKIGSQGIADKQKFTVIGRLFVQNNDSALNLWSIGFEDGSRALLMDGYGHFAVMRKTSPVFEVDTLKLKAMKAGQQAISSVKKHRLIRKENFFKITVEGENEWPDQGLGFDIYDFFCYDGQYTEVIKFAKGTTYILDCKFYLPKELGFTNTSTAHSSRSLTCGNCNTANMLHAHPFTFSLNCRKCHTRYEYDVNKDDYVKTKSRDEGYAPDIPLDSVGIMDGIEFKVIGYARKKETATPAEWNEYTLYNPQMGFAYLSEFEGHWVYVKEWPRPPLITSMTKDYFVENDNEFELYNDYHYKVVGAVGEHIYDLNKSTEYRVTEYIYPPQILTQEINQTEENWFYGDHIEAKKVKESFSVTGRLPNKVGVGAVEPVAFIKKSTLFLVMIIGVVLLLLTHLLLNTQKQERTLFSQGIAFEPSRSTVSGVTPTFQLDKPESNIEVKVGAPVSNNWAEFEGSFVNTSSGKEYRFNKGVEFYKGYDDGGNWSEGSTDGSVIITEVPPGKYYLEYTISKDSNNIQSQYISGAHMEVKYDVPITRNLFWGIGLIVFVALVQFAYFYYNDKRRWENSKYTPYNYE
ncbi:MAG: DUF4178 domain-containing protein [Chitinophagaceae bacterium]|nr:MAG: DUF4178 domain-containing protein [Chitinophagaceae bacterium]